MPIWIIGLIFISGFLLVTGIALMFLVSPSNLLDVRLGQMGEQAATAPKRTSTLIEAGRALKRAARAVFIRVSGVPGAKVLQRVNLAGFHGAEAAGIFIATRRWLSGGLFLIYNGLSYLGPGPSRETFLFSLLLAGMGHMLPNVWINHRIRMRKEAIYRGIPDFVDLLVICVEAGQGIDQALLRVGREIRSSSPILSEEVRNLNLELRAGKPRVDVLRNLFEYTGVEDLKSLGAILIQSERYGVSIVNSLRVYAENLWTARRQAAEERAAKTTIKIAFPLVMLIFPALLLFMLGPPIIRFITGAGAP